MTSPDGHKAEHSEDDDYSAFVLGVTAAVVFVVACYVTATLVYAGIGHRGIPLSPLLLVIPAIPIYTGVMYLDDKLPASEDPNETITPAKNRLLIASGVIPLVIEIALVVTVPMPVLVDTIPVGGAFGLTLTACVITGILLIARGQWINRNNN